MTWATPGGPITSPAWTLGGKPLPIATSDTDPAAEIQVERIDGPVFLVAGVSDELWPSSLMANDIVRRMRAHGRHDVTLREYLRAGHGVALIVPNIPSKTSAETRYGVLHFGGSPQADAAARADSWPRLRFLRNLA